MSVEDMRVHHHRHWIDASDESVGWLNLNYVTQILIVVSDETDLFRYNVDAVLDRGEQVTLHRTDSYEEAEDWIKKLLF